MRRFSEFAKVTSLEGQKIKIDAILDKEIAVTGYRITNSKYSGNSGKCLTLQVEYNNTVYVIFTGSAVLMEQVEEYSEEIPFLATIRKIDKFYSFT